MVPNQSSNASQVNSTTQEPVKKKKRACVECHAAKTKCIFSHEGQSKCDKCLKSNRECVPHISKQGQRRKQKFLSIADARGQSASSDINESAHQNIVAQVQMPYSQSVSLSTPTTEDQIALSSYATSYIQTQIQSGQLVAPPVKTLSPTANTDPVQTPSLSAGAKQNTAGVPCVVGSSFLLILSLRDWIKTAKACSGNTTRQSPKYIDACLRIAASVARQIGDAEETSPEDLVSLPRNIGNWADYIRVKLREHGTHDVYEEANRSAIYNIDSAELITPGILKNSGGKRDLLSLEERRRRIYALGMVFYEMFSGSKTVRLPPREISELKEDSSVAETEDLNAKLESFLDFFDIKESFERDGIDEPWSDIEEEGGLVQLNVHEKEEDSDEELKAFARSLLPTCHSVDLTNRLRLDENNITDNALGLSESTSPDETKSKRKSLSETSNVSIQLGLSIPVPLCDLITNMLDCVNGDFSGEESYTKMPDVTSDLQLMVDKPLIFLHNPTISDLPSAGFQLKDDLFTRDQEYASLLDAYRRFKSGSLELATISGSSGVGKSYIMSQLSRSITLDNGIIMSVKFNQLKHADPSPALVSILNDYCSTFIETNDSAYVKIFASKLREVFAEDVHHLVKILPNLTKIIGCVATDVTSRQDYVNGHKKMVYQIAQFVQAISNCSKKTVTLSLDDVHWADEFSLAVLEQIIIMSPTNKGIFLIACYRDEEMNSYHPFRKIIDICSEHDVEITTVHLECVDKSIVNTTVSELLSLSPRLVRSLSDICYQKTKGNPLFLTQLLISLKRDGLLHLSFRRKRWIWDEEQIQSRQLPNDVASFFSSRITNLQSESKEAQQVLSCFHGAVHYSIIEILETKLQIRLIQPLDAAVDEGFIVRNGERYQFAHDKIKEAAYNTLERGVRADRHFTYGRHLIEIWSSANKDSEKNSSAITNDELLIISVGQFNLAGPVIESGTQLSTDIAQYNLTAAKAALRKTDFLSANNFLNHGIGFLNEDYSWLCSYELTLELHELAVKCALVIGDFDKLTKVSNKVLENACCFEDKLTTSIVVMASLAYASKITDAVTMGFNILMQLGHTVPTHLSTSEIMTRFQQTQTVLDNMSDQILLNYKRIVDMRHSIAIKVLAKLNLILYQVDPDLQPIVTLEMINITIEHGMSVMSPIGFAYYAGMLAKCGEMQNGYRFAKLAKLLYEKDIVKETAGELIFMTSEVISYFEPLQTINEYRANGQIVASAAGDVNFACMLRLMACGAMLYSGANLWDLKGESTMALRYMKGQKHLTSYYHKLHGYRSLSILIGESEPDSIMEGNQLTNAMQLKTFYFQKLFISYILNMYDEMKYFAEKFFETRKETWLLISIESRHDFYSGLASFRLYRSTGDQIWLERGKQAKSNMKFWAENGSMWNFEHMSYLLEAEEHYCCANLVEAQTSFTNAITAARLHKFVHDEALACECAAYFYLTASLKTEAMDHFISAHKLYLQWGATAKAKKIFEFLPETCSGNAVMTTVASYSMQQASTRQQPIASDH